MASDPDIVPRGQYRDDQYTTIVSGGNTAGDGISNDIWLESDVYSSTPASATSLSTEVRPTGTNFSDAATSTNVARILKETYLPTQRRGANLVYDAKNKRFILFGGYNGVTRFNDVYSLSADDAYARWRKLSPSGTPPTAKNLAGAAFVRGTTSGSVDKAYMIVWGGASPSNLNEMHTLDITTPDSEAWSTVSQTNTPATRSYISQTMVPINTTSSTTDLYLFGGSSAALVNDLQRCTFDVNSPAAVTWTTLTADGAAGSPSRRSGAGMIYDSANARLIVSSGYDGSNYLSDAWEYSISGSSFTQLSPSGTTPGGRQLFNIAYDPINGRALLTGGWQGSISTNRNDVIQLSLTSGAEAWTQIKSNDLTNQGILAFSSCASAIDTSRNMFVFATQYGYDGNNKYTWAFDMNDTSATAPMYGLTVIDYFRGRDAPTCVYDSDRSEWLLISGYSAMDDDATTSRGEHVSDIWAYDRTANKWRFAAKGPFSIPANEGGLAVYDSANQRTIYFGGLCGANQRTNDTWELKADSHGMYHATKLSPSGSLPTQRWFANGCYDVTNQRMVMWGGQSQSAVLGDVWELDLTDGAEAWTQLSPTGSAPATAWQSCFAFDSANNRLYIHGGATNTGGTTFTSQLFYLDISTANCSWTDTGVTGGLAVRGATLGYDTTNQRLVCFGGYDGSAVNNTVRYTSTSSFTSWTTQATSNTPSARRSAGCMVIGDYFLVACGRPVSGTWFNDTQELNFTDSPASWAWTDKSPYIYQIMGVATTGLTARASYHWQAWGTTGVTVGDAVAFGNVVDFITSDGTGGNAKVYNGSWTAKPAKVWNGSAWVTKPVKVYNGSEWIQTSY
ncbi:MAG: hypothetical protein PVI21_00660 [Candidatus Woesebacteria bacterium]|jgi:hypothetical protein